MVRFLALRVYDPSLSSTKESNRESLTLYPNPTNSRFYIEGYTGEKNVVIMDSSGEMVSSYPKFRDSYIDIENLKSGLYFLQLGDSGYLRTVSFVKTD